VIDACDGDREEFVNWFKESDLWARNLELQVTLRHGPPARPPASVGRIYQPLRSKTGLQHKHIDGKFKGLELS
jgi:hypothetical protein